MAEDDEDRTVFGQKLPPQPPRPAQPPAGAAPPQYPQPPQQPAPPPTGERTIFGVSVPGAAPAQPQAPGAAPPAYGQPPGQPQSGPPPGSEDTWLGGSLTPTKGPPVQPQQPPQQGYPYPQQPPPQYPNQYPGQQPGQYGAPPQPQHPAPPQQPYPQQPPQQGYGDPSFAAKPQGYAAPPPQPVAPAPGYPNPNPTGQEMQFPTAAQPNVAPTRAVPKIAFQDALRGTGLEVGNASNPVIAAASDILILLGRLRTGIVEMSAIPLRDHVLRAMADFVDKCQQANVPAEDIDVARYALAATADDVVQTIPGNDPQYWQQFSMAAELLGDRSAGIGFFTRLEQVMAYASQRKHVLELMLTCLSLGFEGRYRAEPNGTVTLTRIRKEVYQRFRSIENRPDEDLSHKWLPVILGGRRRQSAMPLWMVASVAAGMVLALFATLSYLLSADARAASNEIIGLHLNATAPVIEVGDFDGDGDEDEVVVAYEAAPTGQLERIQGRLSKEIESGVMTVQEEGDFISIRLGSGLRFGSGSADLVEDYTALMARISEVLNEEPGDVLIEGHSDNVPMSGSGRYKTNEDLSEARAQTVSDLLASDLETPDRLSVVGVGPAKPLDAANTAEARAKNRRVEVLLRKENRL